MDIDKMIEKKRWHQYEPKSLHEQYDEIMKQSDEEKDWLPLIQKLFNDITYVGQDYDFKVDEDGACITLERDKIYNIDGLEGYENNREGRFVEVYLSVLLKEGGCMGVGSEGAVNPRFSDRKKTEKSTEEFVLHNITYDEYVPFSGVEEIIEYGKRLGFNRPTCDDFVAKVYMVQVGRVFEFKGKDFAVLDEEMAGYHDFKKSKTEKSVGDSFPDGEGGYLYVSTGGWNWHLKPVYDDRWAVIFLNGGFRGGEEQTMKIVNGLQNAMQTADVLGALFDETQKSKTEKGRIEFREGMTVKEFFQANKSGADSIFGFDLYSMDLHGKQVATNYTGAKDYADYIVESYQWDDLLGTALLGISITEPVVEKSKVKKLDASLVREMFDGYCDSISESEIMERIRDNDLSTYHTLMNSLYDAKRYMDTREYSNALDCMNDFARTLDSIGSDWDIESFNENDALTDLQSAMMRIGKSKTEKSIDDILNGSDSFKYQMLSRWKSDMEYYFGHGKRREGNLWGGNFRNLIDNMVRVRDSMEEKPDWLTENDIQDYIKYETTPGWYRSNGQWTQDDGEFMYKSMDADVEDLINAKRGLRPQ